jgi:uncharacterized protein (TIRG00374 family)
MKRNFSRLLFIVKIAIAVFTMGFLVKTLHFQEIRSAFQNPKNPLFLVFAVILLIPNLVLQWFRWHYLLKCVEPKTTAMESLASLLGGMVGGFVTPGRIGEISRSLFLRHVSRMQSLGLFLLDKAYGLVPIVVGGVWGMIACLGYLFHYNLFLVWPMVLIGLATSIPAFFLAQHPEWIRNFLYHVSVLFPVREKLRDIISAMDAIRKKQARLLFFISCLLYAVYIIQFCFLAFAFQPIPWTTALTATTATILAKTLLPFSIADLGIREGAAVFFFLRFQVDKITAFNSSLLLFTINVALPTLIGLLFLPKMRLKE